MLVALCLLHAALAQPLPSVGIDDESQDIDDLGRLHDPALDRARGWEAHNIARSLNGPAWVLFAGGTALGFSERDAWANLGGFLGFSGEMIVFGTTSASALGLHKAGATDFSRIWGRGAWALWGMGVVGRWMGDAQGNDDLWNAGVRLQWSALAPNVVQSITNNRAHERLVPTLGPSDLLHPSMLPLLYAGPGGAGVGLGGRW